MSASFDPESVRAFEHARWERAAPVFAASFATATGQFVEALLDAAAVRDGTRVLDVACGSGVATAEAAARGAFPTGVDFSAAMLDVAQAAHPGVTFLQGDAEALPCADAAFDAVVANFGVHHVPRPPLALAEAFRVLGSGGRIAVSFWADPAQNIAWKLLLDAVRRHGDAAASDAPPPGEASARCSRSWTRCAPPGLPRCGRSLNAASGGIAMRRAWWPLCGRARRGWPR